MRAQPNSPIFWNLAPKNIPDRQETCRFSKIAKTKLLNHSTLLQVRWAPNRFSVISWAGCQRFPSRQAGITWGWCLTGSIRCKGSSLWGGSISWRHRVANVKTDQVSSQKGAIIDYGTDNTDIKVMQSVSKKISVIKGWHRQINDTNFRSH